MPAPRGGARARLAPAPLDPHLVAIRAAVEADPQILGLAGGASLIRGGMDEFSDLDLVVVVDDEHHASVMTTMTETVRSWGARSASRGDHVAPLARTRHGRGDNGVRRVEQAMPDGAEAWRSTAARHDAVECAAAIRKCVEVYRDLRRSGDPHVRVDAGLEATCVDHLERLAQRFDPATTPAAARQVASPHVNDDATSGSPPR